MANLLSENELRIGLDTIADWDFDKDKNAICASYKFDTFVDAFSFMTKVAILAEKADHHPDWSNSYNKVEICLSTHSEGGVTAKDLELARAISKL